MFDNKISTPPTGHRLKPGAKIILLLTVGAVLFFGFRTAVSRGWIPAPGIAKALIPTKAALPDLKEAVVANVEPAPFPEAASASVKAPLIRTEIWGWNAQMNYIYANGGPETTRNSLMEKHSANVKLIRQDDTSQMQNDLIACAKELHDGASQCSSGANYVLIMGDGSGQFFAAVNPQLKKLDNGAGEYIAQVIGSTGYSRGEDKLMGSPEWKNNHQAAKGSLVAGVLRDGDWNIAMKWAADNQIKNNPDEKTWDSEALNWVNAPDYIKAAEIYNANTCEDRKVVHDGRLTGESKNVCVNGVVTWTPGDVNVAHGRWGLVSIVSSRQYRSQMPDVIIGIKKFNQDHRNEVQGMLAASFEAADQLKAYPEALKRAAAISAKVYNEQNGDYWLKYYQGTREQDKTGNMVELGGFETRLEHRVRHGEGLVHRGRRTQDVRDQRRPGDCRRIVRHFEWTHRQYRDPRRKHGFGGAACSGGERLAAEKGSRELSRQPFSNSRLWRFQAARLQRHRGWPRQKPPRGNHSVGQGIGNPRESLETGGRSDGNEHNGGRQSHGHSVPWQLLARNSRPRFPQPVDFQSGTAVHHCVPDCRSAGGLGDFDLCFPAETNGCVAGLR